MSVSKILDNWRKLPIYKNKGDLQECENYRGIRLRIRTVKVWEKVIEARLREETIMSKNHFEIMPGRLTM